MFCINLFKFGIISLLRKREFSLGHSLKLILYYIYILEKREYIIHSKVKRTVSTGTSLSLRPRSVEQTRLGQRGETELQMAKETEPMVQVQHFALLKMTLVSAKDYSFCSDEV